MQVTPTANSAAITWDASTDRDPNAGAIVYTIQVIPQTGGVSYTQATTALTATFVSLQASTLYNVSIVATDKDGHTSTAATTTFTTSASTKAKR